MKQAKPISIIVPTLNEADNLPLLFKRIDGALKNARIPYEVIIVDDRSTDATKQIAQNADEKYSVSVQTKRGKRGKAYSLLEGFAAAKYDIVCMVDADLQYPPEAIPSMYHKMQFCDADIVITNRIDNETSALRKLSSTVFHTVFTRALFGISYDTQSGLKLFKKSVLQNITIKPSAWTFDMEFIVRSLEKNYTILSEDIQFGKRNAGSPKIHLLSATGELAWQSLKLWRSTSVKRVKTQYKRLQPLQRRSARGFTALTGLVVGLTLLGLTSTGHTSAASLRPAQTQHTSALTAVTNPLTNLLGQILGTNKTIDVNPVVASTQSQPIISPTPSVATPQPTTAKAAPTTASSSAETTSTQITPSITKSAPTVNPTTLTPQTGKNAAYYPQSKLASHKTNQFLQLAIRSLEVGGGFVLLGILVIAIKKLRAKLHRNQPVWNS